MFTLLLNVESIPYCKVNFMNTIQIYKRTKIKKYMSELEKHWLLQFTSRVLVWFPVEWPRKDAVPCWCSACGFLEARTEITHCCDRRGVIVCLLRAVSGYHFTSFRITCDLPRSGSNTCCYIWYSATPSFSMYHDAVHGSALLHLPYNDACFREIFKNKDYSNSQRIVDFEILWTYVYVDSTYY